MRCENCRREMSDDPVSQAACDQEQDAVFPGLAPEDRAIVCDDCYVMIMDTMEPGWRDRLPAWAKENLFGRN